MRIGRAGACPAVCEYQELCPSASIIPTAKSKRQTYMRTPASFGKHPYHPMLVAIPIGLFVASFVAELISFRQSAELWRDLTFYNLAGGLIGAVVAAVPGFIDYVSLKGEKVLSLAHRHFGVTVALLAVYGVNFWFRTESAKPLIGESRLLPFLLSILGMLLLGISGWLGGEMVFAHGVAVDVERQNSASGESAAD
jgi:uncharacterized membrane protein